GEVTVQVSLQRRNLEKKILEEKVDCGHIADLLCYTDSYEKLCLLACDGPHKNDITKMASDQFHLSRLLKDCLDDMTVKYFNRVNNDETCLYTIGIQLGVESSGLYTM
ncbi:4218_t:CDS:2, partial [Racocetra fulgida]